MTKDLVQYIVLRGDLRKVLKWSTGALVAQACHAATAVMHLHCNDTDVQEYFKDLENMHKVVLEVKDEESLRKLETDLSTSSIAYKLWIEQPENIPTCLVAKPYPKEVIQKHFKNLKLFKD